MIEYRVLKTIALGCIDPEEDDQRDALIDPGSVVGFSGASIFIRCHDGGWIESTTVNHAIEIWVKNGSLQKI